MPIYEFYCPDCHTIFSFLARRPRPEARPPCPRCGRRELDKQVSVFAAVGRAREGGDGEDGPDTPFDESKMEQAMQSLAGEAEKIGDADPKAAADLMRRFSRMTGMEMGPGMQEALNRMEAGEDPESIEAELGDRLEQEDPFLMPGEKGGRTRSRRSAPAQDPRLYDL
jgi:putative FmdB family regulatory protein